MGFLGYNSVYLKKLSELKAAEKGFDATAYAVKFLSQKLPSATAKAINFDYLLTQLKTQPNLTFKKYGKALTIGSTKFFLIQGSGTIQKINESDIVLKTKDGNTIQIATEYIFGNDVRDASGLIQLNDFNNTTDLNNISAEINKIIRNQVVKPFKAHIKVGQNIIFSGALSLNESHLNVDEIEISPITLQKNP